MPLLFATGPVRSGESAFVQALAEQSGLRVTYLATAARDPSDPEWCARLERHERDRPAGWATLESAELTRQNHKFRLIRRTGWTPAQRASATSYRHTG
ncbi:MAG: bifunctional adenosylcobinamide kinase/adenosylcobinamide-phosphate guanylyltransferase [Vulcanimicrobiaceae bacterium]